MADVINLGTINFYGYGTGGGGSAGPDFNLDFNADFRAVTEE